MSKRKVKLYNAFFPIWLIWVFPVTWLIALPINLIIDLLVIVLTMKYLKIQNIRERIGICVFKIWIAGFFADIVGNLVMALSSFTDYIVREGATGGFCNWWDKHIAIPVAINPFNSVFALVWVGLSVLISSVLIYQLDYRWGLREAELDDKDRKKMALSLAIFTAPYMFFFPMEWL